MNSCEMLRLFSLRQRNLARNVFLWRKGERLA